VETCYSSFVTGSCMAEEMYINVESFSFVEFDLDLVNYFCRLVFTMSSGRE